MSKPKLIFSNAAAIKLRNLPKDKRVKIIENLSTELSEWKKGMGLQDAIGLKGTKYVAVPSGAGFAVLRPMTKNESSKYSPDAKEAFFVAELADSADRVVRPVEEPG
ncbi:hypothetical protein ACF07B_20005 [Streptomyces sp. NPDC015532]|uniref:hypothetical protein n=1 Tax=Streptomyces sp. NPDC015532 TaxID=3364960 RepID=UPI0037015681